MRHVGNNRNMKRGIIANTGKMSRFDDRGVSISGNISSQDLNYYLLYWDKIIMPTNNLIHLAIQNEDEIIKTGILERPRVQFSNWSSNNEDSSYDPFVIAQSIVANKLITEDNSTDWTIHQIGDQIVIGNEQKKEFNSVKLELQNCLPIPSEEIHFQDILEFKEKRKDELIALHSTIDDLYLDVLNSADINLAKRKCISELSNAIRNLESSSKEEFNKISKYNFTTELNINGKDIALAIGGGAAFDFFTTGMTIPLGTVLSGLASVIRIKANKTVSVEKSEEKLKLSFLANASKKEII